MKLLHVALLAAALCACSNQAANSPSNEVAEPGNPPNSNRSAVRDAALIPAEFVGEWNRVRGDCGTSNNDSRLIVEPREVQFWESVGEVRQVSRPDSRTVVVQLRLTGEGETWNETLRLVLSQTGNELTIDGFTRQRCAGRP